MDEQTRALTEALTQVGLRLEKAQNRLRGRRPHPNDVAWAKSILEEVQLIAAQALKEAGHDD